MPQSAMDCRIRLYKAHRLSFLSVKLGGFLEKERGKVDARAVFSVGICIIFLFGYAALVSGSCELFTFFMVFITFFKPIKLFCYEDETALFGGFGRSGSDGGACSDKDDEQPEPEVGINTANLAGVWSAYQEYDAEYDEWDYEYGEGVYVVIFEFRTDGTGKLRVGSPGYDPTCDFTYTLSGDVIRWTGDAVGTERIASLTASGMILAADYIGDDGNAYSDLEYFRRVR